MHARNSSFTEEALVKKARAIHQRVITLDTHSDIAVANFTTERNYTQRLDTQVNLPKMFEGGLAAVFFSVYVRQTTEAQNPDAFKPAGYERAYRAAIEKFDAIHRLAEQIAPDKIELALTSADVRRIKAKGKRVALIGVENGYPMGEDIGRVQELLHPKPVKVDRDVAWAAMQRDKKTVGGELRLVLLGDDGPRVDVALPAAEVRAALDELIAK